MKEVISKTGLPDRCLVMVSNSTYLNIVNFIEAFFLETTLLQKQLQSVQVLKIFYTNESEQNFSKKSNF